LKRQLDFIKLIIEGTRITAIACFFFPDEKQEDEMKNIANFLKFAPLVPEARLFFGTWNHYNLMLKFRNH
jgi:hypothetical protein